jgi:hypothetical protein
VYMLLTMGLHFIVVLTRKLLDNYSLILTIVIACLLVGLGITYGSAKENTRVKNGGFGLWVGSLISLIVIVLFMFLIGGSIP